MITLPTGLRAEEIVVLVVEVEGKPDVDAPAPVKKGTKPVKKPVVEVRPTL